ncbi:tripartite tricarboxylate transporter substrate binding protein [Roseomonas sp. NAR14]|uniref:Tripartite tricarboxylate transporter substrate binding protein n=1 Tax=Roseomonas acroporae TaxID=2937791 RepID=A0A9X1Y9H4_9PROT|nr:tripartite tricarboxylate transporter substrate binding protein [Roseomonas acroporae]MCK8786003.1 tripartite tricarboxylate transporter substrate binding protein [Roseomonas acroporae]
MLGRRGFTAGGAAAVTSLLAGTAALGPLRGALAQGTAQPAVPQGAWPEHALRWLVGYPAGGASDVMARLIGQAMAARLGQPVVIDNRPGGGAVLATEAAVRAPADGYTWLHVDNGILVYNPVLYSRLPFDPDRDLQSVGFIGRFPLFLVVRPDSPVKDFAQLVAESRGRAPTYGSAGVASPHHLAMEMLKRRTGLDATHVPYRGAQAAMTDLLGGLVDTVCVDCASGLPFLRAGRARALLVMSEARSAQAPTVPTAVELGHAGAVAYGWQGLSVPHGTPAAIAGRLNADLIGALATPEIKARMTDLGIETAPWTPAEFAAFVTREIATWRPLIRELGIRLDG